MADLTTVDQFAGAEDDVNKQRMDALSTLANFGRRGLEQAVANKQASQGAQDAAGATGGSYGAMVGGGQGFQDQLRNQAATALAPYTQTNQNTADMLSRENDARQTVTGNYFNQVGEALPLYRQNAADITTQYQNAYNERQKQMAHQLAMEGENRAQAAAQLAAIRASMTPDPVAPGHGTDMSFWNNNPNTVAGQPLDYLTAAARISQLMPDDPEYAAIVAQYPMLGNQVPLSSGSAGSRRAL